MCGGPVEDGRERMLDEEECKVDIEDIEEDVPRSILKKRHRAKGSLCRRICNYLRSAWTGVKFSLEWIPPNSPFWGSDERKTNDASTYISLEHGTRVLRAKMKRNRETTRGSSISFKCNEEKRGRLMRPAGKLM
ncbi:hypothetical protein GE061_007524 [Apolygus lucorum]|uniref:Uncharacterized protein n=1 Tax=Apolygus lucorum TaxID=248454 RepID=A0A8S9WTV5_APOLU|nr:hypothetical protein GE061_007524 [Apolygus lucorum]